MKVHVFSIVEGKSFKLCFAPTFASHPRPPSLRSLPTPPVPRFRARHAPSSSTPASHLSTLAS